MGPPPPRPRPWLPPLPAGPQGGPPGAAPPATATPVMALRSSGARLSTPALAGIYAGAGIFALGLLVSGMLLRRRWAAHAMATPLKTQPRRSNSKRFDALLARGVTGDADMEADGSPRSSQR